MYKLVKESSMFYKHLMKEDAYRGSLVEPFLLLEDVEKFYEAKEKHSTQYKNLCDIITKMKALYDSGDGRYHSFANFLREAEDEGFDIEAMDKINVTEKERLNDQIELIRMFMSFKYCPH